MDLLNDKPVVLLPAFFVSPETSLGFGVAAMYYFRPDKDSSSRPSNFQSVFVYTLERQVLLLNSFDIFLKHEQYWLNGNINYYIYPYQYYGEGININTDVYDFYSANYLRIELNAMRKWNQNFYLGPTLFHDHYYKISIPEGGILETNNVTGIQPASLFGLGLSFRFDKRDNLFAPRKGYYLEGRALKYVDQIIGAYDFTDIYLDARKYYFLDDQWETGFNFYHQSILGNAPFYNLALLGNSRIMRGYYEGAYRDHHLTAIQTEIRHYLFDRVVFSAFGGLGSVTSEFMQFDKVLGSYGVGLRYEINAKEHIRIRLDYGRGYQSDGFYININEAF